MRSLKSRGGLIWGRGMMESVKQQWVYGMHVCAAIHEAMISLTGKHHGTNHQHVEFGTVRREHDMRDKNKTLDWLHTPGPFDRTQPQLRSLASCLAASDSINCDETDLVGYEIEKGLDNHSFGAADLRGHR